MFDLNKNIQDYLTGRLPEQEVKELIDWVNHSYENKKQFEILCDYWRNTSPTIIMDKEKIDKAYQRISTQLFENRLSKKSEAIHHETKIIPATRLHPKFWYSIAASIVLLLSFLFYYHFDYQQKPADELVSKTIIKENPKGRKSQIQLPDGTKVWLNAASKLTYLVSFGTSDRAVRLTGEAYFDVQRNESLPFTVVTSDVEVKVLGTEFNVRSYTSDKSIEIVIAEGKVKVEDIDRNMPSQHLEVGQQLTYSKNESEFDIKIGDLESLLAWKQGILIFEDATRSKVFSALERWYGVKISIDNPTTDDGDTWKYTGKFDNESLQNVLNNIGYVKNFDFQIDGKNVIITF